MVFCNVEFGVNGIFYVVCHNPYFNRWFSAIPEGVELRFYCVSHNPYFNRWFSAMRNEDKKQ